LTEIPEHLLKRAAAARAAKGGGDDAPAEAPAAGGDAAPAAAAPAAAVEKQPAAPAPLPTLEEEAPKAAPLSPVVAAAMRRKRVPYWAATVLALLPLWGVIYVASVREPPAGENDPLVLGAEVYTANQCSGCHGTNGEGGTGPQLSGGEISKTFADPLSMVYWIHYGAADGGARPDGTYGDLDREGGPHTLDMLPGVMPGFPDLDPMEMAEVIIYIREGLSGADPADDPNFNSELFAEDAEALAALVEEAAALDPNDPDAVASLEGAESE
jgi:mono/diheme cytochrome c family protein